MNNADVETKKCDGCGAKLIFDGKSNCLVCKHCDSSYAVKNIQYTQKNLLNIPNLKNEVIDNNCITIKCDNCGASIEIKSATMSCMCPYCGNSKIVKDNDKTDYLPDAIIPFSLDKKDVVAVFNNWIKKRKFVPKQFKKIDEIDSIRETYYPSWIFDSETNTKYNGVLEYRREEQYTDSDGNRKTRTYIEHRRVSGNRSDRFKNLVYISSKDNKESVTKILPFNFDRIKVYSSDYLVGIFTKHYDISLKDTWRKADNDIANMIKENIIISYRADGCSFMNTEVSHTKTEYCYVFLPVWLASYMYKGKSYDIFINGTNGNIYGKTPKSVVKIILFVLMIVFGVFLISYLFARASGARLGG